MKQELVVKEDCVEGEGIEGLKRTKMTLPYHPIAPVNIIRQVFSADLEVINKGGSSNLVVKGLKKNDAEKAKAFIEGKIRSLES